MGGGEGVMRVMFLQGHPSPFSRDLGLALSARGHGVFRVNLCFGDWLFWHGPECRSYRGSLAGWGAWIEARMREDGITHLVYFADRHPYHVAAQRAARRLGVICLSYEFGYLRPDWILVEEGGQSAFSHLPDDPEAILKMATDLPVPDMARRYGHSLWREAVNEMAYHLGNVLFRPLWPRFRSDRPDHPLVEYLSYLPRNLAGLAARSATGRIMQRILAGRERFHLVALQMAGDYQIRANSPFADPVDFLRSVLKSFAEHGADAGLIVVKLHPMDNGRVPWRRLTRRIADEVGLGPRVLFLDGGDLGVLLARAQGCVVVNSTVGLHALQAGCPVKTLGIAVYDMPGLTHQGGLDGFWRAPQSPDTALVEAFVCVLAAVLHVRGDFFSADGRQAAVSACVDHLEHRVAWRKGAVCDVPPRLRRAREMGLGIAPWDDVTPDGDAMPSGAAGSG